MAAEISSVVLSLVQPVAIIFFLFTTTCTAIRATYNVVHLGARPDGKFDSTNSFLSAWAAACSSGKPAGIYVPTGRFLVGQALFYGPCNSSRISFKIDGILVAPSDYNVLGNSRRWILFYRVNGVSIRGGTLDGQGSGLWACKLSSKNCPVGATTLEFSSTNNVTITGLTSVNTHMFHMVFNGCNKVMLRGVNVMAAGDSPNTDGIHVQLSSDITILNSKIGTGDDCISIGPGTTNLWMENIVCGPGHGISIGSLAKDYEEAGVQNVTVKNVTFDNTQNGARIKSWSRPSRGFVKGFLVQDCTMINVQYPIVIDQNYCPKSANNCPDQFSGVKISNVTYKGILGTSATEVAVKFDCSKTNPCSGIILEDIKIQYKNETAKAECSNVVGTAKGLISPDSFFCSLE